ncbi:hypothetical protein [Candidatus Skiveiella danica]|uniref:hypothetical protein n=1 Tax=Candidatus Skiveiella danica TaxID=3386177 RepID=UPI001D40EEBA|nr:hypothetical protein [Betaproteobacteria bacterium]
MKEMLMRYCLNATALLAAALLAGCANVVYEGRLSWKEGWREGWVTDVGKGAAIAGKLAEDCKLVPLMRSEGVQYVTIRYWRSGRATLRTVPTTADSHWNVKDLVYLNPRDCNAPVERRAS